MRKTCMHNIAAWMKANADNRAWNACAIVKGQRYVHPGVAAFLAPQSKRAIPPRAIVPYTQE